MSNKTNPRGKAQLQQAIRHFQTGQFAAAELICQQILRKLPRYPDALRILGAVFSRTGRHDEAIVMFSKALLLEPDDADTHYNLGSEMQDMGRLEQAAANYRQATLLAPDYAQAHACLGAVLRDQGNLEEASACYSRAITLNPSQGIWRYNYSEVLEKQGKADESIAASLDCITSDPSFLDAYSALAKTLLNMQFLAESGMVIEAGLKQAGTPTKQRDWLLILQAILAWLQGNLDLCSSNLQQAAGILAHASSEKRNKALAAYFGYLSKLLEYRRAQPELYAQHPSALLHVIGDSHCLSPADTTVKLDGIWHGVKPHLVIGCKAWHLAQKDMNEFKRGFIAALDSLPNDAKLIVSIGEIDCRYDEGIFPHYKKYGGDLEGLITATVGGYVSYVLELAHKKNIDPVFHGVPAPHANLLSHDDCRNFLCIAQLFNTALKSAVLREGVSMIDVYNATSNDEGVSDGFHHLDNIHLKPDFLGIGLNQYLIAR